MTANYLHGVETVESLYGGRSVNIVKSAVIGLIGTAPMYAVDSANRSTNEIKLLLNDKDAAKYFGPRKTGYTIPQALEAIYAQGNPAVLCINVLNPDTHKTAVENEEKSFGDDDTLTLAHEGVSGVVVKDSTGVTTYALTTDYTVDAETGVITRVPTSENITSEETVHVSYNYEDPSEVENSNIIGAVDGDGDRTGMKLFQEAYSLFGFKPKLLITPGFEETAVRTELESMAEKLRAITAVSAPEGTTVQGAINARGATGTINFYTSSKRCVLLYPTLKKYDSVTEANINESYTAYWAAKQAAIDLEKGYWWSCSNQQINGIVGVERNLTAEINDASSEVNALNEAGITTVFNSFGSGFRVWGNRSAAFPTYTGIDNFVAVRRTADVIEESLEYFALQFMDRPISQALIDEIVESVNKFLRSQIQRGAIVDGGCWYDPANNLDTELSAGHLVLDYKFCPPPPLERLTFNATIDITLLNKLGSAA